MRPYLHAFRLRRGQPVGLKSQIRPVAPDQQIYTLASVRRYVRARIRDLAHELTSGRGSRPATTAALDEMVALYRRLGGDLPRSEPARALGAQDRPAPDQGGE